MVVDRAKLLANRARKSNALVMLNIQINTVLTLVLGNLTDMPRIFNTQKFFKEKSGVFHDIKILETLYLGGTH